MVFHKGSFSFQIRKFFYEFLNNFRTEIIVTKKRYTKHLDDSTRCVVVVNYFDSGQMRMDDLEYPGYFLI